MRYQGAYGTTLAEAFHLDAAPTLVTRALRKTRLAVTELRYDATDFGMTSPIPRENAFLVALQVTPCQEHELWLDDRSVAVSPIVGGETMIYDLRRSPVASITSAFHSLHFYIPMAALDSIADEAGVPRITDLDCAAGTRYDDPTIRALAACVRPALRNPEQANALFAEHVMFALTAHVAREYGHMHMQRVARGGLAPWQERRAKEMMIANLGGEVTLGALAGECGLSISHFTRAFRLSAGVPPHRWLLQARIDKAQTLLRGTTLPLADIALACGFADQSHFTRVYSGMVGRSPGNTRRTQKA